MNVPVHSIKSATERLHIYQISDLYAPRAY